MARSSNTSACYLWTPAIVCWGCLRVPFQIAHSFTSEKNTFFSRSFSPKEHNITRSTVLFLAQNVHEIALFDILSEQNYIKIILHRNVFSTLMKLVRKICQIPWCGVSQAARVIHRMPYLNKIPYHWAMYLAFQTVCAPLQGVSHSLYHILQTTRCLTSVRASAISPSAPCMLSKVSSLSNSLCCTVSLPRAIIRSRRKHFWKMFLTPLYCSCVGQSPPMESHRSKGSSSSFN